MKLSTSSFFHRVNLIDNQNHRRICICSAALQYDVLLAPMKVRRLYQPEHHIHLFQCALRHIDHVFTQLVLCLVNTRCIQKYDLSFVTGIDRLNPVSGSLGLIGSNGNLLADESDSSAWIFPR